MMMKEDGNAEGSSMDVAGPLTLDIFHVQLG